MASLGDVSISAASRPVAVRMRPDLVIRPQQVGRRRYWVVKDPVALKYFHLRDEEHAILKMLDGRVSLAEIKRRFERAFAPLQITVERIQTFLGRLHGSGLLLAETCGQGEQFLLRRGRRRRAELLQSLTGLLAIRFRSFDPEPLLRWLYPKCRWLYSPWFLTGCLLLGLAAAGLVTVQFDVLRSRLPDFQAFFSARNVVWMALALAAAKVLHELGHALTCKHFAGECHEMGIMLLVFTPCLYCNVSDSWMLAGRWQRIAITAAGMVVEIVLASACTFLWWFSQPGLLNTLCLNVMFVCSVSTVLFNGNPLLRFDGYFILSDLLEVPNLHQQSRTLVGRRLGRFLLGMEYGDDRALPEGRRGTLAVYGLASTLYRWTVVIAILWFCHKVLQPYGLQLLATLLTVVVVAGLLTAPVLGTVRFLAHPSWKQRIKRGRSGLTCAALAAVVLAICLVPLPFRVTAPVVLHPEDARHVYVSVPGTLVRSLAPGTAVEKQQPLGWLAGLELQMRVEQLTGRRNRQWMQLRNLEFRQAQDPAVASQIKVAKEALDDLQERLAELQRDLKRLTLKAPVAGTVLPPPAIPARPYLPGQLQPWWGSPLEDRNLGCHLETGTLFCSIGDPRRLQAVLVIDQSELQFVRPGQRVWLQLDELPGEVLSGTVTEIARADLKVLPRELATGEDLPVRISEQGTARPLETSYQARVSLDDPTGRLLIGTRGRAKIIADPQSLARRIYRYLRRTFSFEL